MYRDYLVHSMSSVINDVTEKPEKRRQHQKNAAQSQPKHAPGKRLIAGRKSTLIHEVSRQIACYHLERETASTHKVPSFGIDPSVSRECPDAVLEDELRLKAMLLNLDGKCEYCETRRAETLDHFVPIVRNRKPTEFGNDLWNCVPCCKECNSSKGGKTYDEWFSTANSRLNPCGNHSRLSESAKAELWRKFAAYDTVFQVRCKRHRVDHVWWEETGCMIDEFLENLQHRVEQYTAESCT